MKTTETTWKTLALCSVSALAGMVFVMACGVGPRGARGSSGDDDDLVTDDDDAQPGSTTVVTALLQEFYYADVNGDGTLDADGDGCVDLTDTNIGECDSHTDSLNTWGNACPQGWIYLGVTAPVGGPDPSYWNAVCMLE